MDTLELSPGARRFIEGMGLYFEHFGVPRIGGRILGLLMIAERPLTLDDMAGALGVSRASISTNARMSVGVGMVDHVSLPGDRRDYYTFSSRAWERRLEAGITSAQAMRRLAEQGLTALAPEDQTGRARLQTAVAFCNFVEAETQAQIARWQAFQGQRSEARPADATPPAGRSDDDRTH